MVLLAGRKDLDDQNIGNTFIFGWRRSGEWSGMVRSWGAGSVCAAIEPLEQIVVLGADRQVLSWGQDGSIVENYFADRGVGSSVTSIRGRPYIVGMRGLIYRRLTRETWEPAVSFAIPRDIDLEAIAGASEDDMYAVGWDGEIFWIQNGIGIRVNSPTNVILTSVCRGADGFIYCCGRKGTLLRGSGDQWEIIDHSSTLEDLWDVQWFQGKLYVSSTTFLYYLTPTGLTRVDFGDDIPLSSYHISAVNDTHLLSVGRSDVMLFDGVTWTRIL